MSLIFRIRLESRKRGEKWQVTSCETSHWPSAEPILESYVKANPSHEVRLIAEMIPQQVDLMETQNQETNE